MPVRRRQRLLGRLVTGSGAFLLAGVVDWAALLRRWAWARIRGRDPGW